MFHLDGAYLRSAGNYHKANCCPHFNKTCCCSHHYNNYSTSDDCPYRHYQTSCSYLNHNKAYYNRSLN